VTPQEADSTPDAQALRPVPLGQRPVSVSATSPKFPTDAIENKHFIFSKALNPAERNPNPLYPSNSSSFSKCVNTTMCVPTSASVLAFL